MGITISDPVSSIVGGLLNIGSQVIDRLFPDPVKAAEAKLELLKMQQSGDLAIIAGQMDINKVEAGNSSTFVAGWRPFIGWVCGAACAWNWIGISVANTVLTLIQYQVVLKPADISEMFPVLIGMLGLGGLRTIEKLNSVAAK